MPMHQRTAYLRLVLLLYQTFPEQLQLQDHLRQSALLLGEALSAEDPVKGRHAVLLYLRLRVWYPSGIRR